MSRVLRFVSLLAMGLSTAALVAQPLTGGASASFVPPGGTALVIRSLDIQGRAFLSVNDVLAALGGSVQFDESTFSYELKLKSHSAVVGVETPIAVVDTRLVSLSAPVHGVGSTLFADPDFFQKVLGSMAGTSFVWERSSRLLSARKADLPEVVVEATLADFEATTKIVLRVTELPAFRVEKGEETLIIRFPAARLTASPLEKVFDDPRVLRLAVRGSEVHVSLRERNLSTNVYALQNPPRIVVDITKVAATSGQGPSAPPAPRASAKLEPKTIVLDPGHGGTEEGAKGPGGALEKDATLALVKSIREILVRSGYHVVTTRETDTTVGLDERPAVANAAKPDLFLSIHCNASRSPSAHGTEVYYLSLDASDRSAAALAEKENRIEPSTTPTADRNAALRDLDLILWDLAQNQHLSASARLAEIIQADFNRLLGVATRGVKQAPFRVLIGANVPAVLVEVAFITNPEEEKKLASEDFRRQVAETVVGSLATYFRNADGAAPIPPAKTR